MDPLANTGKLSKEQFNINPTLNKYKRDNVSAAYTHSNKNKWWDNRIIHVLIHPEDYFTQIEKINSDIHQILEECNAVAGYDVTNKKLEQSVKTSQSNFTQSLKDDYSKDNTTHPATSSYLRALHTLRLEQMPYTIYLSKNTDINSIANLCCQLAKYCSTNRLTAGENINAGLQLMEHITLRLDEDAAFGEVAPVNIYHNMNFQADGGQVPDPGTKIYLQAHEKYRQTNEFRALRNALWRLLSQSPTNNMSLSEYPLPSMIPSQDQPGSVPEINFMGKKNRGCWIM